MSTAVAAFTACSSFSSSPVDSPTDAGETETSPLDDASGPDGSPTLDGGGRGGFCDSQDADFCEDFDESNDPMTWAFKLYTTIPGSSITANYKSYVSAPNSAAIIAPNGDGGYSRSLLERTIFFGTTVPKKIIIDYDWLVLYEGPTSPRSFSNLLSLQPGNATGVAYQRRRDEAGVTSYGLAVNSVVTPVAQPDAGPTAFRHVHFEADLAASTTSIAVGDAPMTLVEAGIVEPGQSITIFIGANSPSAGTPNMNQLIDNVVVHFER